MEKLFENDHVTKGRAICSNLYCSFVYCIMINRIAKGYSREELSFLVGQQDDFIENIESLRTIDFSLELYGSLRHVFRHTSFLLHEDVEREEALHEITKWQDNDTTIYHRMERYVNERESITVFQLVEEHPDYAARFTSSVNRDVASCQDVLLLLIENGVFNKPIRPSDLHRQVENILKKWIKPRYLKAELDKLWGRKGKAPIKRTKYRSYEYRYVLHPGVTTEDALTFTKQQFDKL